MRLVFRRRVFGPVFAQPIQLMETIVEAWRFSATTCAPFHPALAAVGRVPQGLKAACRWASKFVGLEGLRFHGTSVPAVAEKVGVVETAAEFFKQRAGQATGDGLMKFLRKAPQNAPEPEDVIRYYPSPSY